MDKLSEFITDDSKSRLVRILAILDFVGGGPVRISDIEKTAVQNGLRSLPSWNASQILKRSKAAAVLLPDGWKITPSGRKELLSMGWESRQAHVVELIDDLNSAIAKIKDEDRRSFVREAVSCYTGENFRAAVVLSWSGAVAVMHDYVVANSLALFNQEAKRQNIIKRDLVSVSDFQDIKDYTFIQLAHSIHLIDKNQKQELDSRRQFRNACGHPSALKLSGRMVAAHLESLILNVFDRF